MIDTRFMYKLLKSTEKQVRKIVEKELRFNGYTPVVMQDYIYAAGTIPVLLIAHYDTVFGRPPKFVLNTQGVLMNANPKDGIGADDRAGIYAVLELVKKHHCHVLFTGGEEIGGVGSSAFIKDYKELSVNYMIQFDRRNSNDAVYYRGDNKEFEDFVTAAGFKTAVGSFTDICYLAPHFGVSAVNLSVGYYNEHTEKEELHLNELDETIRKTRAHLLDCDKKFEWVEKKYEYRYPYGYTGVRSYWGDAYYRDPYDIDDEECYQVEVLYCQSGNQDTDNLASERIEVYDLPYNHEYFDVIVIGRFLVSHPDLTYNDIVDYYRLVDSSEWPYDTENKVSVAA